MAKASYAQTLYIRTLALQAGFSHEDDAVHAAGFRNPLDQAEASALITRLKAGTLKPVETAPAEAPEGGITAEQAFALLGKRITVTAKGVKSDRTLTDPQTRTMDVKSISLSDLTGLPVIAGVDVERGSSLSRHFHLIESYVVIA